MTATWLYRPAPRDDARLRLFCFTQAGAAPTVYRLWPAGLPAGVDVCAVQLPGHGARLHETPIKRLPALLDALLQGLAPWLDRPCLFFGHSMGATIAFEFAHALARAGLPLPLHLVLSGRRAPGWPDPWPATTELSDDEFVAEINRRYGGSIPAEVAQHADLMQLLLPPLRADIELLETWTARPAQPLDCPITAFGGTEDHHATRAALTAWSAQTRAGFALRQFQGGHFYLEPRRAEVLAALGTIATAHLAARGQSEPVA